MTISATSRYATSTISTVTDGRGTHQSVNIPGPQEKQFNFTYFQWREFDTIHRLAYEVLGDGRLWWVIAEANPEILDWQTVETGIIIRLPDA